MTDSLRHFRHVTLLDFEFHCPPGERPEPLCMVATDYRTGQTWRLWADELGALEAPPFPTSGDALLVAYYASAELGCFISLGWSMPARMLDLFCEFRNLTNGLGTACGNGLLGALAHFGLGAIDAVEKEEFRELAIRGGPFTPEERAGLLDYCESDVVSLGKLLPVMLPTIDMPRALLRGRYMAAVARMESNGVPIDAETLEEMRPAWTSIQSELVASIDADYGVYVPADIKLDPNTKHGAAIIQAAADNEQDPYQLAEVIEYVWSREQSATGDHEAAKVAARTATGLTVNRISNWEEKGRDYSSYPGLDVTARELAGTFPELGIGTGYETEAGVDDTNYAGQLWELLREPARKRTKHDPQIIEEAVRLLGSSRNVRPAGAMTFSGRRFAEYLASHNIPWPRLESGALALDDDTFRQMARTYPEVSPLRELRHSLGEMRLFTNLAVGRDRRNRCLLSPMRSITGRNQPSNAKFIFGPSTWLRGLIKPEEGRAVAYVDWSQQEFGIAAALSGDRAMQDAYLSADPYLTFAKQAKAVPPDATKQSHPQEREQFKICALAVQYGMGSKSLAQTLGQPEALARELLQLHRSTYPTFWRWSDAAVNHAMLLGWLRTVFGWRVQVGQRANPRSLGNFLMQANGAEMLRLACCLATERDIAVCAPIHDALLVEGTADEIDSAVEATQQAMAEASRVVLDGFELRSDAKIVRHPDRYMDPRGQRMWDTVLEILHSDTVALAHPYGCKNATLPAQECNPVQSYF